MPTPPAEHPLNSTESYTAGPSAHDAPSVPAADRTVPQVRPSHAALADAVFEVPGYEIQGELGRGGMGVVYLAKNVLMNRPEVLKVANRTLLDKQPGAAERFLREIRAAAKLSHENVVKAYSALQVGDMLVFAMEYIEGEDLAKLVQRQGPLAVTYACHYISQAALGLQHAHEQGMVHRDIKPHNLILSRRGKKHIVKVLDFGLAKAREGETVTDLTGQGAMMGTPAYVAPEQAQDAASADIRADIYSLGCTLYFLLTGAPPFTGKSHFAVLQAHLATKAAPLSQLRRDATVELEAVVAKMMAKDPALRYQTPIEAAKALAPIIKPGALLKGAKEGASTAPIGDGRTQENKGGKEPPAAPSIFNRPTQIGHVPIPTAAAEKTELRKAGGTNPVAPSPAMRPRRSNGGATISPAKKWWVGIAVGVAVLLAGGIGLGVSSGFRGKTPEANSAPTDKPAGPQGPPRAVAPFEAAPQEPPRAVAPFEAAEAKRLQQAWADYLGVPVMRQVDLGGGVVMKLVLIPPGTFPMGSPDSDKVASDDEKPQHQVTITKPFYLGMYPVTQEEYVRVTGLKNPSAYTKGGSYEKDVQGLDTVKFPVEEVSWTDAAAFCEALNRKDSKLPAGWKYALPTEAEWEHACRSGTTTAYFFGGDPKLLSDYAWYGENAGARTHEVGTRKPNPWGLYDMGGNVYQWCADYYDGYGKGDAIDPQNLSMAVTRVLRGSSCDDGAGRGRAAYRHGDAPANRLSFGFRVRVRLD
jgi:formylglycine-generating enzyme required for sulfatase activity/serine/threonine protein kinase